MWWGLGDGSRMGASEWRGFALIMARLVPTHAIPLYPPLPLTSAPDLCGAWRAQGIMLLGMVGGMYIAHWQDPHTSWENGIGYGLALGVFFLTCLA